MHSLEFKFTRRSDMDCLYLMNMHVMISKNPNKDCNNWCINNNNCGGYAAVNTSAYPNRCYFKKKSCKKDLHHKKRVNVFLKEGKEILELLPSYFIKHNIQNHRYKYIMSNKSKTFLLMGHFFKKILTLIKIKYSNVITILTIRMN